MKFTFGVFLIIMGIVGITYATVYDILDQKAGKCKDVWNVELTDDENPYGGISYAGETVGEFCKEAGLSPETKIRVLNRTLKTCGICPVPADAEPEEDWQ